MREAGKLGGLHVCTLREANAEARAVYRARLGGGKKCES